MPQRSLFELPRIDFSKAVESFYSFDVPRLQTLGVYSPGGVPVLYDPLSYGSLPAEAVAGHELRHQFLMLNTTFGLFTQILQRLKSRKRALIAHAECMKRQWPIQELSATYAGLTYVAIHKPEALNHAIETLPSAKRSQDPYRELFESIHRWVPLAPDLPQEVVSSRDTLVALMSAFAMSSDCLVRLKDSAADDQSLVMCLEDLPARRFEKLMSHLLREEAVDDFCERIANDCPPDDPSALSTTSEALRLFVTASGIEVQSESDLRHQAEDIVRDWLPVVLDQLAPAELDAEPRSSRRFTSVRPSVRPTDREPLPSIRDSREREERQLRDHPIERLAAASFRMQLSTVSSGGLGLSLELAVRENDLTIVHVALRPYFLSTHDPPRPCSDEDMPDEPLPADVSGLIGPLEVIEQLADFSSLPHIVVFVDGSLRGWKQVPYGDNVLKNRVRICRQTHLSVDHVRNNILSFENLGRDPEVFVLRMGQGRHVGCFFSRSAPSVYGLQKIPSEFGLGLFNTICADLQVSVRDDAAWAVQDVPLLKMVGFDYAWH